MNMSKEIFLKTHIFMVLLYDILFLLGWRGGGGRETRDTRQDAQYAD
jgi:hypothetical protein